MIFNKILMELAYLFFVDCHHWKKGKLKLGAIFRDKLHYSKCVSSKLIVTSKTVRLERYEKETEFAAFALRNSQSFGSQYV